MNKTLRKSLFFILKICVTLLVISPFYIAIIYSVKSKPEMVTNRLAFPKTIHWDNFTRAIETSNFGLAMKNSLTTTVVAHHQLQYLVRFPVFVFQPIHV